MARNAAMSCVWRLLFVLSCAVRSAPVPTKHRTARHNHLFPEIILFFLSRMGLTFKGQYKN